jgi:hypothetical protein
VTVRGGVIRAAEVVVQNSAQGMTGVRHALNFLIEVLVETLQ